mmetsp:Transcript_29495/g.49813  ORF Transcript_29495/g.49813 Transcript_29495/m.49813 type:complete len:307 (-) Transcript_29495:1049-1969(-)
MQLRSSYILNLATKMGVLPTVGTSCNLDDYHGAYMYPITLRYLRFSTSVISSSSHLAEEVRTEYLPHFPSRLPKISSREHVCTSGKIRSGSTATCPFRPYCLSSASRSLGPLAQSGICFFLSSSSSSVPEPLSLSLSSSSSILYSSLGGLTSTVGDIFISCTGTCCGVAGLEGVTCLYSAGLIFFSDSTGAALTEAEDELVEPLLLLVTMGLAGGAVILFSFVSNTGSSFFLPKAQPKLFSKADLVDAAALLVLEGAEEAALLEGAPRGLLDPDFCCCCCILRRCSRFLSSNSFFFCRARASSFSF